MAHFEVAPAAVSGNGVVLAVRDESDGWLAPPEVPLEPGVALEESVTPETVTIHTNRPGHPLLVKISYHPRWRAEGADGPYLVSPALMMVIPKGETVRLHYASTWADAVGWLLTMFLVLHLYLATTGETVGTLFREMATGVRMSERPPPPT